MKITKSIIFGATAVALSTAAFGQNVLQKTVSGTTGAVKNVGGAAVSGVKNVGGSALSGVKGLASMPGKALNFGSDALPDLSAGTQEFGLSGNIQFNDDIVYNLNLSYGYFFKDNWEVGFNAGLQGSDVTVGLDLGLFTEYNFDLDSKWVPFVGASIGLASLSVDGVDSAGASVNDDITGLNFGGVFGVKYFIRENIAISGSVDFQWSPDDVFGGLDDASSAASNVNIGTRFYF